MDKPQEVIDIENLVTTNSEYENLKCPICHNIFNDPKACGNCLNHFCRNCIQIWCVNKPTECPLCKDFSMNRPVPILINLLSKLQFNCPNRLNGCSAVVVYQEYIKHCRLCPEKIVQCSSEGCFDSFKQKELGEHEQNCPYTFVPCIWCNRAYIRSQLKPHIKGCSERLEECSHCQQMFKLAELDEHSERCPQKPVECRWCRRQAILMELVEHENTCELKQVSCLGCKNKMTLLAFYPHQNVCQDYPVVCNRCNQGIRRKDYLTHNLQKCMECFSRKHSQQIVSLKAENTHLKTKIYQLENKEINRNSKKFLLFSQILRDPDIFVNQGFAMVRHHKKKNRDRFLLMDSDPLGKKRLVWKIKVRSFRSEWFAVGISDQSNVYILHRYQNTGHCSYLASANGTIYSTHNAQRNHQRTDFVILTGDVLECVFDAQLRPSITITNVTKGKSVSIEVSPHELEIRNYFPCICLRCAGDSVEILPNQ